MKKIILLLSLLLSSNLYAMEAFSLNPMIVAGNRFGDSDLNNKTAFYVSAKMTLFEQNIQDFKQLNFLSLGINYQDDKKWAYSISPVSVNTLSGLTIGLDYIPKRDGVNGGAMGIFLGVKFQ